MKADLYNLKGAVVGSVELNDAVFGATWNADLVHQAVATQIANKRAPIAHARTRGEVSGGGKKPWRQKGTGRARHGSIRSPIWKGGGVAHGPRNERSYAKKLNKAMKRQALYSALSRKLKDGNIKIVDTLTLSAPKTKELAGVLKNFYSTKPSVLLVPAGAKHIVFRASRNIPNVKSLHASSLNVYDVIRYRDILIDQSALSVLK